MKAVVYRGPGEVAVEDVDEPRLRGPRDVVVRVSRTAICGTDLHPYRQELPRFAAGTVLGHEFAGVVAEAGTETPFRPGDRVFASDIVACGRCLACAHGMHYQCRSVGLFGTSELVGAEIAGGQSEYVRVPFADVVLRRTPDGVTDEQALFVGDVLSTAYQAVESGGVRPGDVVAVVGGGPVGVLSAACARLAGAAHVVIAEPAVNRRNTTEGTAVPPEQLAAATRELSGGWGPQVVIEAVGSPAALRCALDAAAPRASVVVVGVHHGDVNMPAGVAFAKELTLRFVAGDPIRAREPLLALISSGRLDPAAIVSDRMPLYEAARAYARLEAQEAFKIVLTP